MSEYQQFTDEDSVPSSPSLPREACVSDSPPPYFPPTDEGNAQYTWGASPACGQSVTSLLPIDGPKPPPYSHIDIDAPPPFDLHDTEYGHPTTHTPVQPSSANDTSVVIQQPNGTELPSVVHVHTPVPNDYLGWSICGCLCCIWSLGICAIISSYDSRRAADNGDMANAKTSSLCALRINIINMVVGVVVMTYCLLRFGLGY
ncbi:proline-rich transmembrane protein 1-like isoform X1 [Pecten maximus]|uniref:proline-rich transmembrane protein 1-like isoform X1 n=1 Tax=Pecten maximus TaxID=6579 RepID=UPI001458FCEC|nr:proline-rich transmembrane protein 1-like isoform X1 [Pecten maximus]XP_033754586.1 proline-rich transmembrane protein 1-like isoform X1 [Pecten maximus]XP_033754587.1 proline-rich transmembrane protein 1-like isoform X1 [Pecten maximus]